MLALCIYCKLCHVCSCLPAFVSSVDVHDVLVLLENHLHSSCHYTQTGRPLTSSIDILLAAQRRHYIHCQTTGRHCPFRDDNHTVSNLVCLERQNFLFSFLIESNRRILSWHMWLGKQMYPSQTVTPLVLLWAESVCHQLSLSSKVMRRLISYEHQSFL